MAARIFSVSLLSAAVALAMSLPAAATPQDSKTSPNDSASHATPGADSKAAPSYDSDQLGGGPLTGNCNTPEADGRPGEYYFLLGARAYRHHDYAHAVAMWKGAASWAAAGAGFAALAAASASLAEISAGLPWPMAATRAAQASTPGNWSSGDAFGPTRCCTNQIQ